MRVFLLRQVFNLKFKNKLFYSIIIILFIVWYYNFYDNASSYNEIDIEQSLLNDKISKLVHSINYNTDKLQEFKLNQLKIIRGDIQKRVVFNGFTAAGYANKIYSMLSALVIAIITDSALIIRWNDIEKYIEEPLDFSFKKFNKNSFFNAEYRKSEIFVAKASSYAWKYHKNMNELIKTYIPLNRTRIIYNSYDAYFFEICSNPKYFDKLLYFDLVRKETIDKARHTVKNIKKMDQKDKTKNLLQVGFEVGGSLLNRLWKPLNNIQKTINYYVNGYFQGYFVIGIQFRLDFLYDEIDYSDIPIFLDCALNLEENIAKKTPNFYEKYSGFKWFISTDHEYLFAKLSASKYWYKMIYLNHSIGKIGHIESDSKYYVRTILDNELLSRCDEIIITGGSTFGFLAAIKKEKKPYYINGKIKMNKCKKHELSDLSTRPPGNLISQFFGLFFDVGDNASII